MIPDKTIPFVFMHFEMNEQMYDLKLMADMRKFFFKPELEKLIYEKMRSHFLSEFNKSCPKYTPNELTKQINNPFEFDEKAFNNGYGQDDYPDSDDN